MDTVLGYEWRVGRRSTKVAGIAINNRTYGSEENAARACERLQACDANLDNTYVPLKVCIVLADKELKS